MVLCRLCSGIFNCWFPSAYLPYFICFFPLIFATEKWYVVFMGFFYCCLVLGSRLLLSLAASTPPPPQCETAAVDGYELWGAAAAVESRVWPPISSP